MGNNNNLYVTCVICTHNRAGMLGDVINSLLHQTLPREYYEILIVDNGSTDNTKLVVDGFQAQYESVRYIFENKVGLSAARNAGWKNARAEIVAYLDDDAEACTKWVKTIYSSFKNDKCLHALVGKVVPRIGAETPDWFTESFRPFLGEFDLPSQEVDVGYFPGGNSSFRKEILQKLGGFCESLGRKGDCLLSGEDNYLWKALLREGYTMRYSKDMLMYHIIDAHKLTPSWIKRRNFWQGVTEGVMTRQSGEATYSRIFRYFKAIIKMCFSPVFYRSLADKNNQHLLDRCSHLRLLGYFLGLIGVKK